jgi:hypothetical protein
LLSWQHFLVVSTDLLVRHSGDIRKCPSAIFHIIKPSLRDSGATASTSLMLDRRTSSVGHALPLEIHCRWKVKTRDYRFRAGFAATIEAGVRFNKKHKPIILEAH